MSSTLTRILLHVVFSTKDRLPSITPIIRDRLYDYMRGIVHRKGASLFEIRVQPCKG